MSKEKPFFEIMRWTESWTRPFLTDRALNKLCALGFLTFVAAVFLLSVLMPGYSYDMVMYIGASLSASGAGTAEVHQQAWAAIKQAAPADTYQQLSQADAYRRTQSNNPEAFASVIPLYSVKIGYVYLLGWLGTIFGYIKSSLWISHLSGLLLGLCVYVWMKREQCLHAAPLLAGVLLAGSYVEVSRYAIADTPATMLTIVAIWLWLNAKEWPAYALLVAAFLFRPDTIVFIFALVGTAFLFRLPKLPILTVFAVTFIASLIIQDAAGHPGWWTHFYFSNVTIQNSLVGFDPALSLFALAKGYTRGVFVSLTEFNWPVLLIASLTATLALVKSGYIFATRQSAMLLALVATIGGKFILFPLPDDRLYLAFVLAITLILATVWQPRLGMADKA